MLNNLINRAVYNFLKYLIKTLFVIVSWTAYDVDVLCKERHERFLRRTSWFVESC